MNSHFAQLTRALLRRRQAGHDESRPATDPFRTLMVQLQLSRMSAEIHRLEHDQGRWARAHHLAAATAAYDDLLLEAARLSDVPVPDAAVPVRRLMIESALRHHGWSW
ncbi:hypothetical protein CLV30_104138 [Haloactinopolyspora alba]|uniref:Uncharacterized protein n=1 Tax=Haloactinopolyspora alba TaxID=648780 RepID=A0A2P8E731_9ACTN|nr:hypothetical protein [Haloactinopolyspora alba]PSL05272.1 hypothetical protein CLV30_104138 [Haloactinopolyspora alba]